MDENRTINSAVKWSALTEILAKLVSPITSMILARLLAPDVFGIVASITMVTSFCDLFTDIGCNKYIIQHDFDSEDELYRCATVGFWTNLGISVFIWMIILLFRDVIARYIGIEGYGTVVVVAALSIIMTAFSSVQIALMRRQLDFKRLCKIRLVATISNLLVSTIMALNDMGYWSIIAGNLSRDFLYALLFTLSSKWKPKFYYSLKTIKSMFSFSGFSFLETIITWFKSNVAILILSGVLSSYMLGLYKTPISIDNSVIGLLYSALVPVLYSGLSRVKDNKSDFQALLFKIQKLMALCAFPIGMALLVFSDIVTYILLGSQWMEIAWFVGLYGCAITMENVFCIFCVEAYRAKGKPQFSALTVAINSVVITITLSIASNFSFEVICYITVLNSLIYYFVQMVFMKIALKISPLEMLNNVSSYLIPTVFIGIIFYAIKQTLPSSLICSFVLLCLSMLIYVVIVLLNKANRTMIREFIRR